MLLYMRGEPLRMSRSSCGGKASTLAVLQFKIGKQYVILKQKY
jgi:hypothetical protein